MTLKTPPKKYGSNLKTASQQTRLEAGLLPASQPSSFNSGPQKQDPKEPSAGELIQGSRQQLKAGNQQLNHQLNMKANELEKLFAKLRLPRSDHPSNITTDDQTTRPLSYTSDYGQINHNYSHHDSRGKSYDSYMKKRDAKLTKLWDSNGVEKQVKMKAMHDTLDRHANEMKAKYADKQNSTSSARRRAERLRSFHALRTEEPLVAAIPRSATKLASTSGRLQQQQPDYSPLAQSVPSFSDLRKENTKPYSTATKAATRSQSRNYTGSRSTNETPKRFLRKNNAKLKASMSSEAMRKEEEDEQLSVVNEEEFDKIETEHQVVMSNESEKLMDSELEQGNMSQSISQVDHTSVAELPGESPMSWNSHSDYPFSYTHDVSDAESPVTSAASWNLHPTEAAAVDSARMRKKWGTTSKPNIVSSSSDLQSRKDTTRGFKRLLKFGRKSCNTENLADYISATTSEGDDDTKDGRDPTYRYRRAYTEAPRSLFSLSTFRSKGSESKPR